MGMKKDGKYNMFFFVWIFIENILAVQKERDRLGRQRVHHYNYGMAKIKSNPHLTGDLNDDDDDDLSVTALLRAEQTAQEVWEKENEWIYLNVCILYSISVDKFD